MTRPDLERMEARSWSDIYEAAPAWVGASCDFVGKFCILSASGAFQIPVFNRAFVLDTSVDWRDVQMAVDRIGGNKDFAIQIPSLLMTPELRKGLERAGFTLKSGWTKLLRRTDRVESTSSKLKVREISTSNAKDFGEVVQGGFSLASEFKTWFAAMVGTPGWHFLVGYSEDGKPVSSGALRVDGQCGWMGIGATIPEARNQGGQSALISARIELARRLGCEWVCVETGSAADGPNPSLANLERLGFTGIYDRMNYHLSREGAK